MIAVIPPRLHPGQLEVLRHPARFKIVVAGRRWGKTRLGVLMALDRAIRGGRVWWVAPVYNMANAGWELLVRLAGRVPGIQIRLAERIVQVPGGGQLWVRSADNPHRLRGFGLDLVVLDEAAFMRREVWYEVIRPALMDRQGEAVFISTPFGRNWFYDLVQTAESLPNWKVWRFPSAANPFLSPEELEDIRLSTPTMFYRQEALAEFISGVEGAIIRREWIRVAAPPPLEGLRISQGVDLAISKREGADYTAIATVGRDSEGRIWVLDVVRARLTFHETLQLIQSLAAKWKPGVIAIERVQYQAAVVQELLRTTSLPVVPATPDRDKLTRALPVAARYEQGLIYHAPNLPREFEEELLSFPEGEYDDQVDALVYAVSHLEPKRSVFI